MWKLHCLEWIGDISYISMEKSFWVLTIERNSLQCDYDGDLLAALIVTRILIFINVFNVIECLFFAVRFIGLMNKS